jgi:hypothetical protein
MLGELVKAVLERALDAELTAHLGYERREVAGHNSGNSRGMTSWLLPVVANLGCLWLVPSSHDLGPGAVCQE